MTKTSKTSKSLTDIQNSIIQEAIAQMDENGWSWTLIQNAARKAGVQDGAIDTAFPGGLTDAVAYFSTYIDHVMMDKLNTIPTESLRVRDKVRTAVMTRYQFLKKINAQQAVKASLAYWALPTRVMMGQQILWATSDKIWQWAGDTATDYNRYTKRGLLSSIIMGTSLVFIDDTSEDLVVTRAFLDRRIDNIMEIGKVLGGAKTLATTMMDRCRQNRN